MISLYNENFRYTELAVKLDEIVCRQLKFIFDDLLKEGLSPREISQVMQESIKTMEYIAVLSRKLK